MKYDSNNNEEEEGEQFDFESGDEVPEADRQAPSCKGVDEASGPASPSPEGEFPLLCIAAAMWFSGS